MDRKYQPMVLNHASVIIEILRETNFFVDYELESEEFAMDYLCGKLTEKFIHGELNDEFDIEIFSEEEMEKFLREIVAGSILLELQEQGLIDSIEDENNEEYTVTEWIYVIPLKKEEPRQKKEDDIKIPQITLTLEERKAYKKIKNFLGSLED